ncbi:hypothetical protein ACFY4I_10305 [Streptomyces scabiei]|uniref:hypothetical protein n=1 Tax=Streptomyces scabiei TaxID=1930 RepID=UPI0036848EDF
MPLEEKLAQLGSAWPEHRIVDPGDITVMLGASATDIRPTGTLRLTGPVRRAGHDRVLHTSAHID